MANFSNRHDYYAPLHYPMSITAIEPVCPQTILPMRVTLFTSGMLCVTHIPLINGKDTLSCSELNVEHAGDCVFLDAIYRYCADLSFFEFIVTIYRWD